jgi:hypothetical protein
MDCDNNVNKLRQIFAPKEVKEISEVDWKTVSKEALENDTFANGDPFYLVFPRELWGELQETAYFRVKCQGIGMNGNLIPDWDRFLAVSSPFPFSICINIANPNQFNLKRGLSCVNQGQDWYALTCYSFCH